MSRRPGLLGGLGTGAAGPDPRLSFEALEFGSVDHPELAVLTGLQAVFFDELPQALGTYPHVSRGLGQQQQLVLHHDGDSTPHFILARLCAFSTPMTYNVLGITEGLMEESADARPSLVVAESPATAATRSSKP